jgi:predicted Fe-Mo cluster-binding NifX family protein
MKLALTTARNRITPVFDSATFIEVYESEGYGKPCYLVSSLDFTLGAQEGLETLFHIPIDTVICGAISIEVERLLTLNNVEVYSFLCGSVEDVLQGWQEKRLDEFVFSMPGCSSVRHCPHRDRGNGCRKGVKGRKFYE